MEELVFDSLKIYFETEIENAIACEGHNIIVSLGDGTKAKVEIKNLI